MSGRVGRLTCRCSGRSASPPAADRPGVSQTIIREHRYVTGTRCGTLCGRRNLRGGARHRPSGSIQSRYLRWLRRSDVRLGHSHHRCGHRCRPGVLQHRQPASLESSGSTKAKCWLTRRCSRPAAGDVGERATQLRAAGLLNGRVVSWAQKSALPVLNTFLLCALSSGCVQQHVAAPESPSLLAADAIHRRLAGHFSGERAFVSYHLDLEPSGRFLWRVEGCTSPAKWATGTWHVANGLLELNADYKSEDCTVLITRTEVLEYEGRLFIRLPGSAGEGDPEPPWGYSVMHRVEAP